MKSYNTLTTCLLTLSILISSLLSGAVLATPDAILTKDILTVDTKKSDKALINRVVNYVTAGVISREKLAALIKRLTTQSEPLKTQKRPQTDKKETQTKVAKGKTTQSEVTLLGAQNIKDVALQAVHAGRNPATPTLTIKRENTANDEVVPKTTPEKKSVTVKKAETDKKIHTKTFKCWIKRL